jgi:hypothetical protein
MGSLLFFIELITCKCLGSLGIVAAIFESSIKRKKIPKGFKNISISGLIDESPSYL